VSRSVGPEEGHSKCSFLNFQYHSSFVQINLSLFVPNSTVGFLRCESKCARKLGAERPVFDSSLKEGFFCKRSLPTR
jgi:hypothetical protein